MQPNNNNPFQPTQPQPVHVDDFDVADPTPLPQEPISNNRPPVALDGVSPSYTDIENTPEAPVNEPESAPNPEITTELPPTDQPDPMAEPTQINEVKATSDNYVNPLLEQQPLAPDHPINSVPNLPMADDTVIEIGPKRGGMGFKPWQFFLVLGIAIIGVAGTAFFLIEYNRTNVNFQESLIQLDEYRRTAETGERANKQLEELQQTVRDQADKITELKEENDKLKKLEDELKTVKAENEKLKKEKEELVNSLAKLMP